MGNESRGLRFDIYERVHLSEDMIGIGELEEIELLPHIQVITQDNEAVLRGHLLLASAYVGNDEQRSSQTMEHFIPVEITLPIHRVRHIEDISVVIDHFDVDLLSARSLNITGVLSLQGIDMESTDRAPNWDEEITFVHQASTENEDVVFDDNVVFEEDAALDRANEDPLESVEVTQQDDVQAETRAAPAIDQTESFDGVSEDRLAEPSEEVSDDSARNDHGLEQNTGAADAEESVYSREVVELTSIVDSGPTPDPAVDTNEAENLMKSESLQKEPGDKEPKVAFGKRADGEEAPMKLGVGALLQTAEAQFREMDENESVPDDEPDSGNRMASGSTGDELDWKTLFLSSAEEEPSFRKVRICIVQKEESLDMIADRYQMNPREILLYNRLSNPELEEGQTLYIPK